MELVVRVSVWVYRGLLVMYPRELRARFAADMAEVFEDWLRESAKAHGPSAVAAVWSTALAELAVALPAGLEPNVIIAAGLSLVVSSLITWVFLRAVG